MKRQRNADGKRPAVAVAKRKAKRVAVAEAAEEKVVESRKNEGEYCAAAAEEKEAVLMGWDQWPTWWSVVNEQMSWGSFWCPSWDIESLGEAAYNALYSDLVWDDDLWDLKGIKEVPNP